MGILQSIFFFLRAFVLGRAGAAFENLALRQQVAVFKHSVKRPRLRPHDRVFWVALSGIWPNWRSALAIVQPETVIRWHRKGFKLYWRWKSRPGKPGRPPIDHHTSDETKVVLAKKLHADKSLETDGICRMLRISRSTFYWYVWL